MGKRTKEKSDEEIERKIRRLEKELSARKKSLSPICLQNEDPDLHSLHASSYNYREEVELEETYPTESVICEDEKDEDSQSLHDPVPNDPQPEPEVPSAANAQTEDDSVPEEYMEVLGEAKKSEEIFGRKIPQGVSERLGKILIEGLEKEQKETLLTKTLLIPENFQLAKAPKLNDEIASVLTDPAKNRDKRLEKLQNQLGSGIAGLVNLTTDIINKDLDKMTIIKRISEANQILLDLHHEETMSRRRLILPILDKNFINVIKNVKRDQFLFGENLEEKIKTIKSIERSSLQIKKPVPSQPSSSRRPFAQAGNSRAPARQGSGPNAVRAQPSTSRYYPAPQPAPSRRPPAPPARRAPLPPPPPRDHERDYRIRRR